MCCFCLGDFNRVYLRFLMLIFIVLGGLSCNGDLIGSCGAVMFYWEIGFGVRRSISLYCLLMMFV